MTTPFESFVIDPYATNINSGTQKGQKLFIEACVPLEESKRLTASVANQRKVMVHIGHLVQRFRWGPQVLAVRLVSDQSVTKSILTQSQSLCLDDFKVQAYKIWGGGADTATEIPVNATTGRRDLILTEITITSSSSDDDKKIFYARVRSTMIRKAIEGNFCDKTLRNIKLQCKTYQWKNLSTGFIEEDGATMLKILVDVLKPSLRVGLKEFKTIIGTAHAKLYENDPIEMLDAMEKAYDEITVSQNATHGNYMDDLFKALKTFPNRTFVDFVVRLEDDWEASNGGKTLEEEVETLLIKVRNKYNNMVSRDTWTYVDPNEAKILALTTHLDRIQKQLEEEKKKTYVPIKDNKQTLFDIRRTQFTGDKTTLDGIDYEWCNKGHKSHASPNGMYMPVGRDHEAWEKEREKKRGNRGRTGTQGGSNGIGGSEKKMILSDKMKACLITKAGFSSDEADAFIQEAIN